LEDVSLLDVRGKVEKKMTGKGTEESTYLDLHDEYLEGHIPGACFVSWLRDGIDSASGVPVQLTTDGAQFCACMEEKGVSSDRPVVVYDLGDNLLAPRLWWALTYHGHPEVYVLDGGWAKWESEGRPTTTEEPCPLKVYSEFSGQRLDGLRTTREEILDWIEEGKVASGEVVLIDARDEDQFHGRLRRAARGGRIAGAVSLPRRRLLHPETGAILPAEQQREILEEAGVKIADGGNTPKYVAYCNGGVAATTVLLALHRLGIRDYANYDGSWNEWGNCDDVPIEE